MKQQKQDRRSLRTRQLVRDALMALLREKRYSAISVQDLLDRAGIGRSTFYAHYYDKDDALASVAEQMLTSFQQAAAHGGAIERRLIPSGALFQHAWEQRELFEALAIGRIGERHWEAAQGHLARTIEQTLNAEALAQEPSQAPAVPARVIAQYLAGAFLSLFRWWLEAETPYPPAEIDSMFQRLAAPGIVAALGAASHSDGEQ